MSGIGDKAKEPLTQEPPLSGGSPKPQQGYLPRFINWWRNSRSVKQSEADKNHVPSSDKGRGAVRSLWDRVASVWKFTADVWDRGTGVTLLDKFGVNVADNDQPSADAVNHAFKSVFGLTANLLNNEGRSERKINIPYLEYRKETPPVIIKNLNIVISPAKANESDRDISRSVLISSLNCQVKFPDKDGREGSTYSMKVENAKLQMDSDLINALRKESGAVIDFEAKRVVVGCKHKPYKSYKQAKAKIVNGRSVLPAKLALNTEEEGIELDNVRCHLTPSFSHRHKRVSNTLSFSDFRMRNESDRPALYDLKSLNLSKLNQSEGSKLEGKLVVNAKYFKYHRKFKKLPAALLNWTVEADIDLSVCKGVIEVKDLAEGLKLKPAIINFFKTWLLKRAKAQRLPDGTSKLVFHSLPRSPSIKIPGLYPSKDPSGQGVINIHEAIAQKAPGLMVAVDPEDEKILKDPNVSLDILLQDISKLYNSQRLSQALHHMEHVTEEQISLLTGEQIKNYKELLEWASMKLLKVDHSKSVTLFKKIYRTIDGIPDPCATEALNNIRENGVGADESLKKLFFICKAFPVFPKATESHPLLSLTQLTVEGKVSPSRLLPFLKELMMDNSYRKNMVVLGRSVLNSLHLFDERSIRRLLRSLPRKELKNLSESTRSEECKAVFNGLVDKLVQYRQGSVLARALKADPELLWEVLNKKIKKGRKEALAAYIMYAIENGIVNGKADNSSKQAFPVLIRILLNPEKKPPDTVRIMKQEAKMLMVTLFQSHFNGLCKLTKETLSAYNCECLEPLLYIDEDSRIDKSVVEKAIRETFMNIKDSQLEQYDKKQLEGVLYALRKEEDKHHQLTVLKSRLDAIKDFPVITVDEESETEKDFFDALDYVWSEEQEKENVRSLLSKIINDDSDKPVSADEETDEHEFFDAPEYPQFEEIKDTVLPNYDSIDEKTYSTGSILRQNRGKDI